MRLAVVAAFLNEAELLPVFLRSLGDQTRPPDELVLVDDGSTDGSTDIARAFVADHSWARLCPRPVRPPEKDRLATAAELKAFHWGVEQLTRTPDVVVKLDADLELRPDHFETALEHLRSDPGLGVTGAYLAHRLPDGRLVRETHPREHVRGPNKTYRWACYSAIQPIAPILGWDTFDDVKARMSGWRTASFELPDGDSIHLRPTGLHDGRLRAYRRWGWCAWGYGAHPLHVIAGAAARMRHRPYVVAGLSYLLGWAAAALRREARVEASVRAAVRREELRALRRRIAG